MSELFHYKGCGLDYIYLMDGYTLHSTEYGDGYSIKNAVELHNVIASDIVTFPACFRGQEVRFLRSVLELTQTQFAEWLGVTRGTIANYEKNRDTYIQKPHDSLIRYLYRDMKNGERRFKSLLDVIHERDCENVRKEIAFRQAQDGHWQAKVA